MNVEKVWIVGKWVGEKYNEGIGVEEIMFGENFDGEKVDRVRGVRKKGLDYLCKGIKEVE